MKKMLIAAAFAVSMIALAGCGASYDNCGVCQKPSPKPVCDPCVKAKPAPAPVCKPCEVKPVKPVCAPCKVEKPAKPACEPCKVVKVEKPKPAPVCNTCPPREKKTCTSCYKFKMPKFKCNRCVAPAPAKVCNTGCVLVDATPAPVIVDKPAEKAPVADAAPAAEKK